MRVQRAGRGHAAAAAVIDDHRTKLERAHGATDEQLAAEDEAEFVALRGHLSALAAVEHLRGSSPDADAAEAALQSLRSQPGVDDELVSDVALVVQKCRQGYVLSAPLRAFRVRTVECRVRAFALGPLRDALGIEAAPAGGTTADDGEAEEEADEEECSTDADARSRGWRDRSRRLAEALFVLAFNQMIGNQATMPNLKQLFRLLSRFMHEPDRLASLRSRMRWSAPRGAEKPWLRLRAVRLRYSDRAVAARAELDVVQSSDNASFWNMVAPGVGLTERINLCSWTALGEWHMHPFGGRDESGRELSRKVGRFLVTNDGSAGSFRHVVVPRRGRGELSSTHLRLRLPDDRGLYDSLELTPYDGTVTHAVLLAPTAVNLSEAPTMLTHQSEAEMLEHAIHEEWAGTMQLLIFDHGALDNVSTRVLPWRPRRFGRRPAGAPPGTFEEGPAEGLLSYSKSVHWPQWTDDKSELRVDHVFPTAPVAEDSLSSEGQAAVVIEEGLRHNQTYPGYFNRLPEGDGHRIFHQGDVGTEKVTLGLLRRARQALYRATLDVRDPRSAKFESEQAARAAVRFFSMLAMPDHLHAPLHNGMALVKGFFIPHWKVASLDQIKVLLGLSGIRPSKEGESYRPKRRLLRVYMLAYNKMLIRRFHTDPEYVPPCHEQ